MPASSAAPVIVGMSGGVDSSTTALLLSQDKGYAPCGLFMRNWEADDEDDYCHAESDFEDAKQVCRQLNIPIKSVNFYQQYWDKVFTEFIQEHHRGRTPNPDILCNKEIKFKAFLEHALELGASCIATGHYARVAKRNGSYLLLKGRDFSKDQSYFLYTLTQKALSNTLFPLGELNKSEVRRLAAAAQLATHAKKDSTGICFIGERKFQTFLAEFILAQPGEIRSLKGETLGTHQGLMFYTLGQRKGLGIGGRRDGNGEPWYVVDKDLSQNYLWVTQNAQHPALYHQYLQAESLHWIDAPAPVGTALSAKTRYRQQDEVCQITALSDTYCQVLFKRPQRAITPGQSVVFYDGDICLGGGIIHSRQNEPYQDSI
jgi:tRNA-uridine 2-sulfurtransferase